MFCEFGFKTYLAIVINFGVLVKGTGVGPM